MCSSDELNRSNMASLGDSEKIIQHLNEQLQEAQELANTEKLKCIQLKGLLDEERRDSKHQVDESANQIKVLKGQLQQLQSEVSVLKEQRDEDSSRTQGELHRARDEVRSLQQALEAAAAERDREVITVQSSLATVTKDLDKWRQTASKYEREIDNLQGDLRQQSMQWQKTAEIQAAELQSMQKEHSSLQKECAALRSEKQDLVNKHQAERGRLQGEGAALRAQMDQLLGGQQEEMESVRSECAALRAERDALLGKRRQMETALSCSQAQNAELSDSLKSLERSQEDLGQQLGDLQLRHQQDSTKLQTQLEEAQGLTKDLQKENEDGKAELSDLKEKFEKTEQEKQSIADELQQCQAEMKLLHDNGSKVRAVERIELIVFAYFSIAAPSSHTHRPYPGLAVMVLQRVVVERYTLHLSCQCRHPSSISTSEQSIA
ncbi:Sarcolemmal membrane-associated protein [Merluccius polli]|uniref:Sarcolemmal membrane-associated protein n=1 Tax=Merluccius polli TaxID=89951 RepID=A0AA47NA69_MERPO|nr:Sarcolemmal membrane-associated protein [Merluccius polli]